MTRKLIASTFAIAVCAASAPRLCLGFRQRARAWPSFSKSSTS